MGTYERGFLCWLSHTKGQSVFKSHFGYLSAVYDAGRQSPGSGLLVCRKGIMTMSTLWYCYEVKCNNACKMF